MTVEAVEPKPGPASTGARDPGTWKEAARVAAGAWVTARVVVLAALGFARYLDDEVRPGRAVVSRTIHQGLFAWDGAWYRDLASHGYGAIPRDALRFFPGFPMSGRVLGTVLGDGTALVVIANVAAFAAAVLLYRLVRWERGDAALATRSVWFLSLAPPAFVFVMAYSDALAIAFTIATFLLVRRRQWWWAAAAAAVVGVTRPTGMILAVPVLIEACRDLSTAAVRERVARAVAVIAAPFGTLVYLAWVGATRDDPLLPYSVQTTSRLHGEFANPFTTLSNAVEGLFDHRVGTALHVPWLVVMVVLVVVVFLRWPASYGVFAALVVASSVTSTNLDSLERYGLFAFPLVLAVADLTERKLLERIAFVVLPVALFAYAVLAFSGLYVP